MNDNQPDRPISTPGRREPAVAAGQPVAARSDQEIKSLLDALNARYPLRRRMGENANVNQQVLIDVVRPFRERKIDAAEAEKSWKRIASVTHLAKPAPSAARQPQPTPAQAAAPSPSSDMPKPTAQGTEKALQDAGVPPASSLTPGDTTAGTGAPPAQSAGSAGAEAEGEPGSSADVAKPVAGLPAQPPKPAWKVLEPEERSDPIEHEVCDLVIRNEQWSIVAASVRGKLHAHRGLWRDDAFAYDWVDDWTIIAVSDGAGSAKISRVAARIACDESVKVLKGLLTGHRLAIDEQGKPTQNDLMRVRTFLTETAQRAQAAVLREAQARKCPPRDLNATLLLMLHAPLGKTDLVAAIQVGDGAVGIYTADGTCTLLGIADHGEYSSETRFLTTPNIEREFPQRVLFSMKQDIRCLAAMCDGVSDDFFPESKRLIELFVGDPIPDMKTKEGGPVRGVVHEVIKAPQNGESLREWLTYEKKGSSDDRTLVLMYRSRS